ncbi:PRADC1-like protein [Ctenocephalides felis]|uniref:PRADC1-like protein n=1 Tax=Ctenocephalides felis TaxID=7515 RepID=UPI000E6E54E1|nr:PRADC1-like protein [Ctenocephalides felis]
MDFQHCNIIILLIFLSIFIHESFSGLNNLHMHDGASIHDVTNGDIFFEIVEPRELEYTYRLRPAKDFGAPFNSSISLLKSHLIPVEPPYACEVLTNQELFGKVALIERGKHTTIQENSD